MNITRMYYDAQDLPKTRALFSLVGAFCVDPAVRADLGAPISSEPGDTWILAQEKDKVEGFCIVSNQKNGRARLHALYAPMARVQKALRDEAVLVAAGLGAGAIAYVAPAIRGKALGKEGWKAGTARGQYRTFEREV